MRRQIRDEVFADRFTGKPSDGFAASSLLRKGANREAAGTAPFCGRATDKNAPDGADLKQGTVPCFIRVLPPLPGACRVCAARHQPEEPHAWDSLYYQVRFYQTHRRFPTREDAGAPPGACESGGENESLRTVPNDSF